MTIWLISLHVMADAPSHALHRVRAEWTHPEALLPDSSNFVTASILIISPGSKIYSILGHSAIRMECPTQNLDICFSLETGNGWEDYIRFGSGHSRAQFLAFETPVFLALYKNEGRGVRQYELNLTHREKQRLWQQLDQQIEVNDGKVFNILKDNCTSGSIIATEKALANETLSFGQLPDYLCHSNGHILRYASRQLPWVTFIYMSFLGSESDEFWPIENRMFPEKFASILRRSSLVGDYGARPVMTGSEKMLLPIKLVIKPFPITPTVCFAIVLAIVIIATLIEHLGKCKALGRVTDIVLFGTQAVTGIVFYYVCLYGQLFGLHWNWYLLVFTPLPIVIWLIVRQRRIRLTLCLAYTVALIVMLLCTPLSSQLDLPHQLITAAIAVRCIKHCREMHSSQA